MRPRFSAGFGQRGLIQAQAQISYGRLPQRAHQEKPPKIIGHNPVIILLTVTNVFIIFAQYGNYRTLSQIIKAGFS
jgi:hypothetical protein